MKVGFEFLRHTEQFCGFHLAYLALITLSNWYIQILHRRLDSLYFVVCQVWVLTKAPLPFIESRPAYLGYKNPSPS